MIGCPFLSCCKRVRSLVHASVVGGSGDGSIEDGGEGGGTALSTKEAAYSFAMKNVWSRDVGGVTMPWWRDGDRFRFLLMQGDLRTSIEVAMSC